jgi:transposase
MPRALALPLREQIAQLRQQGLSYRQIAECLDVKERTVREICRRYRQQGEAGLQIHYERCGVRGIQFPAPIYQAALSLKREHPRWGAPLIRLQLAEPFPDTPLPGVRTLQSWFRAAGLQPVRPLRPPPNRNAAHAAHEVWQVDAKERMRLGNGSGASVLTATDEASGAILEVRVFSPV